MAAHAGELLEQPRADGAAPRRHAPRDATADRARAIRAARRLRSALFDADLFAEPAWDLLLDLYADDAEGIAVPAALAARALGVPASVGARWIVELERRGAVLRTERDGEDLLRLTTPAREKMRALLLAMPG